MKTNDVRLRDDVLAGKYNALYENYLVRYRLDGLYDKGFLITADTITTMRNDLDYLDDFLAYLIYGAE